MRACFKIQLSPEGLRRSTEQAPGSSLDPWPGSGAGLPANRHWLVTECCGLHPVLAPGCDENSGVSQSGSEHCRQALNALLPRFCVFTAAGFLTEWLGLSQASTPPSTPLDPTGLSSAKVHTCPFASVPLNFHSIFLSIAGRLKISYQDLSG